MNILFFKLTIIPLVIGMITLISRNGEIPYDGVIILKLFHANGWGCFGNWFHVEFEEFMIKKDELFLVVVE